MESQHLKNVLESCLLVAGRALSLKQLETLFSEDIDRPDRATIKQSLLQLQKDYDGRGIELVEVASGWRLQSRDSMSHWISKLLQEKPPRYSRALLETLVLIAYRQPITRGEIETIRGVAVSSNIMRSLQERDWIREMGHKEVPGRPVLWGTTRQFLDYFNLTRLDELPSLEQARDLDEIEAELAAEMGTVDVVTPVPTDAANDSESGTAMAHDQVDLDRVASESVTSAESETPESVDPESADPESVNSELINPESATTESAITESGAPDSVIDKASEELPSSRPNDEIANLVAKLPGGDAANTGNSDMAEAHPQGTAASSEERVQQPAITEQAQQDMQGELTSEHRASVIELNAQDTILEPTFEQGASSSESDSSLASHAPQSGYADDAHLSAVDSRTAAESTLHQVVDSFATEHRQQLDEQSRIEQSRLESLKQREATHTSSEQEPEQKDSVSKGNSTTGELPHQLKSAQGSDSGEIQLKSGEP
ncbi:MAG: SMC-Scp complex subunit ScpB [Granulosicoccus sp.]|nr:SMC-Scp complex subunit ScpB [Granulosicoccus sp.]